MANNQNFSIGYNVDLVLCIDKTGSMAYIIDEVKRNALNFHQLIINEMAKLNMAIDSLRIRVVAFGCIGEDKANAFRISDFFEMNQDAAEFANFVGAINAEGGGDESGLNALAVAIASPWNKGPKMRQIIMMFTDEDSHDLEKHRKSPYCPKNAPANMLALDNMWAGTQASTIDKRAKRLVVFGPDNSVYLELKKRWERMLFYPQDYGKLRIPIDEILRILASTISSI